MLRQNYRLLAQILTMSVVSASVSCGDDSSRSMQLQDTDQNTVQMDVDIDTEGLDRDKTESAIAHVYKKITGKDPLMTFEELLTILPLTDGVAKTKLEELVARRDELIRLSCTNNICQGSNSGKHSVLNIPEKDLTITVSEAINFTFRIDMRGSFQQSNNQYTVIEFCTIKGVHAQRGLFGGNVDGSIMQISPNKIEKFVIDVGFGGSYPNQRCKL